MSWWTMKIMIRPSIKIPQHFFHSLYSAAVWLFGKHVLPSISREILSPYTARSINKSSIMYLQISVRFPSIETAKFFYSSSRTNSIAFDDEVYFFALDLIARCDGWMIHNSGKESQKEIIRLALFVDMESRENSLRNSMRLNEFEMYKKGNRKEINFS